MSKIRHVLIVLAILLCPVTSVSAQVSVRINLSVFPDLVVVAGYPVYYAPRLDANYFFYDGMYWIYQDDDWYTSSWYNGPWWLVYPENVPVFILRIPVRYYRQPPVYFYGWRRDAPPRWGDHWGHDWDQHRRGWDRWDRRLVPPAAPPPVYQRQYAGDRYPKQIEQQHELQQRNYRYQPQDPVVRQHYQDQLAPKSPAQRERQRAPEDRGIKQQGNQRYESPQRRDEDILMPPPASPQQGRPEVQEQRRKPQQNQQQNQPQNQQPSSDERARQMQVYPPQQTAPGRQDAPATTRSQRPRNEEMNVDRSVMPPAVEERTESNHRRQQSEQWKDQREQSRERPQPNEQRRYGNTANEADPRGQEQRKGPTGGYRNE